ncbi:effector binding domain-containing protein [Paenibacillus sp. sgz5001063]|uniref:AraC family transcriptional regulator n=1 Tax=Paenibacillus sp. sgz5001063 TaxID=3242474 RepID=UPI0036D2E9F5
MSYYQRIQLSLDYIEEHLQEELRITEIAGKACFSAFHFQRMFLAVSGFTVHEYIRKRRLTEAAKHLRHSSESVLQISLDCQYQSQEAFTRAFQSYTGVTPGKYRKSLDMITASQQKINFLELHKNTEGDVEQMDKPTLIQLERTPIIGCRYKTSLNGDGHYADIPAFYDDFGRHGRFMPITEKVSPGMSYGISCDYQDNGDFSFIVGEAVSETAPLPDENYHRFILPAGKYAMFKAYGPASLTPTTRNYIYGTWLPNSGYERREGPDFEITDVMNSSFPDHMRITIYIPVD